jgi:ribosomal protein L19E
MARVPVKEKEKWNMKKNIKKDFRWLRYSNKCPRADTCPYYNTLKCAMFKNHSDCSKFKLTDYSEKTSTKVVI